MPGAMVAFSVVPEGTVEWLTHKLYAAMDREDYGLVTVVNLRNEPPSGKSMVAFRTTPRG